MSSYFNKKPQFINNIRSKIDEFLSDEKRWYILFVSIVLSYFYILYNSFYGSETEENLQFSYFLNPNKGGYRETRGDLTSPSLFKWDYKEIILLVVMALISFFLFYKLKQNNHSWFMFFIQVFIFWFHSVAFLFFIPINDFHKRVLYNTRATMISVVNDPLKELFIAFVFIVLLPLPGARNTLYSERMSWLAVKMGVFYIIQNILLGPPRYEIEPSSEGKIIPEKTKDLIGYGVFLIILFVLFLFY